MTLAPPPRSVPSSTNLAIRFGGLLQQAGWVILGAGMVLWWAVGAHADTSGVTFDLAKAQIVSGVVVSSETTNWSAGGTRRSRHDRSGNVREITYRFRTPAGVERTAVAYGGREAPQVGQRVRVEWVEGDQTSRIRGLRNDIWPQVAMAVGVVPVLGLILLVWTGWRSHETVGLLRRGQLAYGKVKSKQATFLRFRDTRIYEVTLAFEAPDGQVHELTSYTDRPDKLGDDAAERLVYDPENPDRAASLDDLPGGAPTDRAGALLPAEPGAVLPRLILPALVVLGNLVYLAVG